MSDSSRVVIWAHRNAESIFGAASNPVVKNGSMLIFDEEEHARAECAYLNARSNYPHVHYSMKRTAVRRSAN